MNLHNLQEAHIQRLGYLWYFNVPFASRWGFETLSDTLTLFSNLVRRALFSLAFLPGFVYLEYKKYSSSKSNQSCRQYPVDRLMITPNYIPCLGETHTKLYAIFKTARSLKSHTLFISISPYRPYKGVPPGHTGCRIQRSRSVRVRLDWLQSLSYSKICERVRYRTRSQTCV